MTNTEQDPVTLNSVTWRDDDGQLYKRVIDDDGDIRDVPVFNP